MADALLRELIETTSPSGKERKTQELVIRELHRHKIKPMVDKAGNIYAPVKIPRDINQMQDEVLFTAHMDCVHNDEIVEIQEGIIVDTGRDRVPTLGWCLAPGCSQKALGADDKVGVRILLHMIEHGLQGLYLFTTQEECGCIGARHASKRFKTGMIKSAICFDRKDTCSVITAMGGQDCCSDEFSEDLIEQLGMGHRKDRGGSITDTKCFKDVVNNFTNISAGYYHEHGKTEWLDIGYVERLMENVLTVDWYGLSDVPYKRASAKVYQYGGNRNNGHKAYKKDQIDQLWLDNPKMDTIDLIKRFGVNARKTKYPDWYTTIEISQFMNTRILPTLLELDCENDLLWTMLEEATAPKKTSLVPVDKN